MNSLFDEIYGLLKKYKFIFNVEVQADLLCTICKDIMINAYIGPCGCKYCLECIMKHLNEDNIFCPNDVDECQNQIIDININLHFDYLTNNNISKLIVKCPEKSCNFKDELIKIGNHIRVCNYRHMKCPYSRIGCKQSYTTNESIREHFLIDIIKHSELLLEYIENLQNEIETLRKEFSGSKSTIERLKQEIEILKISKNTCQIEIARLNDNNYSNQSEIHCLNHEIMSLATENRLLRNHIENLHSNMELVTTSERKSETNWKEINKLKQRLMELDHENKEIEGKVQEVFNRNAEWMERSSEHGEEMKVEIYKQIRDLKLKLVQIGVYNCEKFGEYEWNIKNVSQLERNVNIYGEAFYSHKYGYKMCLSIKLGAYWILAGLCLMRGEFDSYLAWPFQHGFTIELINPHNQSLFKSILIKYFDFSNDKKWKRPKKERNDPIYKNELVTLNEFSRSLKHDQIIIKCKLNIIKE